MNKYLLIVIFLFSITDASAAYRREDQPCCRSAPKWYAGISGSAVFLQDVHYGSSIIWDTSDLTFKPGYGISGSLGYLIHPDIAVELEIAYRRNDVDEARGANPSTSENQAQTSTNVMANAIYSHHNSTLFSPYIGIGAGLVNIKAANYFIINGTGETRNGKAWVPGYQTLAGISYDIPNSPISLLMGYRFILTQKAEETFTSIAPPDNKVSYDSTSHNVEFGARLHF